MSYEDDLRYRLEILRSQIERGKVTFAAHLAQDMRASLEAVKYGPDGQPDLDTVDGRVRSMALAIASMKQREDVKEVSSLRDVQLAYFASIEGNFGELYKNMLELGGAPYSYSKIISKDDDKVDYLYPVIATFMESLLEFWKNASDIVTYHLQDLKIAKGVFGGDLFPVPGKNLASTCGLYLDTIIITDPFMNSIELFTRWDKREAVRYFIKHAMSVLAYKELAVAEVNPPIVVILPFASSFDEDQKKQISEWAEGDAIAHGSKIFGREFGSIAEFLEFGRQLDTPEKVVAVIKDRERLLFDVDWTESAEDQLRRGVKEFASISGATNAGMLVVAQCIGRMMQATDLLAKSRSLGGTPLIEAPTSWRYFNWKLEYDAPVNEANVPLHMLHGLQWAGKTDVEWLGNIPPAALIEMRKEGAVQEIRDVLSKGVAEIAEAQPQAFFRTADQIVGNIETAFEKHQENLAELKKKNLKFWGHDIGSWVVTGSIGVAAAITSLPALAIGALAADQILDAPKLRDIPRKFGDLQKERRETRRSPMGLFFRHKKGN